jgi:NAD(P)-dependent dehydrogenase (short-subunit alcohol dehydrogenase family)
MGKLDGKIALVTGGSSGIGLATAKRFVDEGAYVFITGRREAELTAAVTEIAKNVSGIRGDVADKDDLDHLFEKIRREKGRLDIVFANAGAARYGRLGDITEELYHATFDVNVKGLIFTVQKALPLMPTAPRSSSTPRSSRAKGFPPTASIARPRRRCAPSRGPGPPT